MPTTTIPRDFRTVCLGLFRDGEDDVRMYRILTDDVDAHDVKTAQLTN